MIIFICQKFLRNGSYAQRQGCQIFLSKIYQNGGKYTELPQHYKMAMKYTKRPQNIPPFSILRPFKIYPNWSFWFESKPSGNPAQRFGCVGRVVCLVPGCPHRPLGFACQIPSYYSKIPPQLIFKK
jgi:hypothetical protein